MKKVGIITFHSAHNYGAVLQGYALLKKIESLGYNCKFIDLENDYLRSKYSFYPKYHKSKIKYLKDWLRLVLDFKRKKRRASNFTDFIEQYLPSYSHDSVYFDSVILGSDQIWNSNITHGFDPLFFGIHKNINCNNVFSYAASMGNAMSGENYTKKFKQYLSNLNAIGVREDVLSLALKDEFELESTVTLDPTLILGREEWNKITLKSKHESNYILVYQVEEHGQTKSVIDYIVDKTGYDVKVISSKSNYKTPKNIDTTSSPQEFLTLFKHASFVVTSSFHGTVFSVLNEIPFYTMKFNNGVDTRSSNLLKNLGIENRHIEKIDDNVWNQPEVDFSKVELKLNNLRKESVAYLISCLDEN